MTVHTLTWTRHWFVGGGGPLYKQLDWWTQTLLRMTFGFMENMIWYDMIWYDATWCNLYLWYLWELESVRNPTNITNIVGLTFFGRTGFLLWLRNIFFARPPGLFAIRWNLPVVHRVRNVRMTDHASCGETFGSWIGYDWIWLDMIGWCKNPLTLEVVFLKLLDVQVSPGSFQFPPSCPGMFVWCMAGWIAVNERFTNASDAWWSHGGSFWAYSSPNYKAPRHRSLVLTAFVCVWIPSGKLT